MKKIAIIAVLLFLVVAGEAKGSLIEVEPKASLYIGSVRFGLGCDVIVNPLKNVGFRLSFTELSFGDYTQFYLNMGNSLDALIYFPVRGIQPYVHTGFGFNMIDTDAGSSTYYTIRGGLGLNYPWSRNSILFVEPGVIIAGNGESDVWFRLSVGARFGIIR
jgi:hypothetical protein